MDEPDIGLSRDDNSIFCAAVLVKLKVNWAEALSQSAENTCN